MARGVPVIVAVVTDDRSFAERLDEAFARQRYYVFRTTTERWSTDLWERPWDVAIIHSPSAEAIIDAIRRNDDFVTRFLIAASPDPDIRVRLLDSGADEAVDEIFAEDELLARLRAGQRTIELKQSLMVVYDRLALLAITDGLTGLYNHRHFQEKLGEAFEASTRSGEPMAVLILDVDHFKRVNDRYGHVTGDRLLIDLSNLLAGFVRAGDIVARYGGEEFALILPGAPPAEAHLVAERIRSQVSERPLGDSSISISVSVGVASHPAVGCRSAAELLRRADEALYRAKRVGRNRVVVARKARHRDEHGHREEARAEA